MQEGSMENVQGLGEASKASAKEARSLLSMHLWEEASTTACTMELFTGALFVYIGIFGAWCSWFYNPARVQVPPALSTMVREPGSPENLIFHAGLLIAAIFFLISRFALQLSNVNCGCCSSWCDVNHFRSLSQFAGGVVVAVVPATAREDHDVMGKCHLFGALAILAIFYILELHALRGSCSCSAHILPVEWTGRTICWALSIIGLLIYLIEDAVIIDMQTSQDMITLHVCAKFLGEILAIIAMAAWHMVIWSRIAYGGVECFRAKQGQSEVDKEDVASVEPLMQQGGGSSSKAMASSIAVVIAIPLLIFAAFSACHVTSAFKHREEMTIRMINCAEATPNTMNCLKCRSGTFMTQPFSEVPVCDAVQRDGIFWGAMFGMAPVATNTKQVRDGCIAPAKAFKITMKPDEVYGGCAVAGKDLEKLGAFPGLEHFSDPRNPVHQFTDLHDGEVRGLACQERDHHYTCMAQVALGSVNAARREEELEKIKVSLKAQDATFFIADYEEAELMWSAGEAKTKAVFLIDKDFLHSQAHAIQFNSLSELRKKVPLGNAASIPQDTHSVSMSHRGRMVKEGAKRLRHTLASESQ